MIYNSTHTGAEIDLAVDACLVTLLNIDSTTSSDICSNDFNNLPNNKVYGVGLLSEHSVQNTPLSVGAEIIGQVVTFGKQDTRTSGDTLFFTQYENHAPYHTIHFLRMYMGNSWTPWVSVSNGFLADNIRNTLLTSSKKAANVNIDGIMLMNQPLHATDMPSNGNWIFEVKRYSANYILLYATMFDQTDRGKKYFRVVHRNTHTVLSGFDWTAC